ncbi:hypothetical protein QQF64_018233 [Cirrhinus molitorella]|uniref:Uncharacterized protein n=1 Tax=Cirrhinus molitorella TaxID=172907 RepID=A0ABR3LMJ0_9TELE
MKLDLHLLQIQDGEQIEKPLERRRQTFPETAQKLQLTSCNQTLLCTSCACGTVLCDWLEQKLSVSTCPRF